MNRSRSYWLKMTALLGGGAAAGVIGASALNAGAAQSSTSTTPAASTSSATSAAPSVPAGKGDHDGDGPHGGGPHGGGHVDEKSVTSAQSATLKAEALKHVSGGTVERVESDSGDAAFEVHMTNAGGNRVTVKFDKALKFIAVEDGMGK